MVCSCVRTVMLCLISFLLKGMSCTESCALFFKKKAVCVSDPCAAVGLNCRSYGADSTIYDCQSWCCERDSATLGIFVVVIIIIVLCCAFCCAFGIYRFVLRKRAQAETNGVIELDVHPPKSPHRSHDYLEVPASARSAVSHEDRYPKGQAHRRRKEDISSSSQGKTRSGDQHQEDYHGYDDYTESAYTGRSKDEGAEADNPDTGFLDEPTVSARSEGSQLTTGRAGKQLNESDYYYDESNTARSGTTKKGVWEGETHQYEETRSRDHRRTTDQFRGNTSTRSEDLFTFEDDF